MLSPGRHSEDSAHKMTDHTGSAASQAAACSSYWRRASVYHQQEPQRSRTCSFAASKSAVPIEPELSRVMPMLRSPWQRVTSPQSGVSAVPQPHRPASTLAASAGHASAVSAVPSPSASAAAASSLCSRGYEIQAQILHCAGWQNDRSMVHACAPRGR